MPQLLHEEYFYGVENTDGEIKLKATYCYH